jgi:hypothetical protein
MSLPVSIAAPSRQALATFLLGRGEPPAPEVLRAARVAAYAYTALPPDHPLRPHLRGDYLAALARHQRIKQEVAPLVTAWRDAGIEALFFKGFHLAEFVYPAPGARFHGDVDLVLREEELERAARIAGELGWLGASDVARAWPRFSHGALALLRPGGSTFLEAQRFVVHSATRWTALPRRLTAAVWENSLERAWEGTTVRLPHPVDALLVCLVLHRCWDVAPWALKPHDPVDFRLLAAHGPVTHEEVWARARELRCDRTLGAFLERCDPWDGRWEVEPPALGKRLRLDLSLWPERTPRRYERRVLRLARVRRLARVPRILLEGVRALPAALAALRALRRERDLSRLLASLTPAPGRARSSERRRFRTVSMLRRLARFLPHGGAGPCVVRSLVIYTALQRQGWPVVFVSGVRREAGGVVGHAWVELGGTVLPELGEPPAVLEQYAVNFRYPAEA